MSKHRLTRTLLYSEDVRFFNTVGDLYHGNRRLTYDAALDLELGELWSDYDD